LTYPPREITTELSTLYVFLEGGPSAGGR